MAGQIFAQHDGHARGELKHGRYIGYITLDSTNERVATVADFYLEAPDDWRLSEKLHVAFKLSLGGYNTQEYHTEIFKDIRSDYENGVITLDEPQNDLMVTAEVHTMGSSTFVMGTVFVRSSAVTGTLELQYETDEPGDNDSPGGGGDDEPGSEDKPFIPLLEGQYEGHCGQKPAAFQIQTVRGLRDVDEQDRIAFGFSHDYSIVARLAYRNSETCGAGAEGPNLCTYYNFQSVVYNPFLAKLTIQSDRSTNECQLRQGRLQCRIRIQGASVDCDFRKADLSIKPGRFYARQFHVRPSADQVRELPPPLHPGNEALAAALRGPFSGYMHNETNNTYQSVRLNVMPYSATDHTHNNNQMMIAATAIMYFDQNLGGDFFVQRFEPRSFYLRPGLTLNGPNSDTYISIVEWTQGYIRGIWYSHAFGKVGTVQLTKGDLPPIPSGAILIKSFAGEFENMAKTRWFTLIFPAQPSDVAENLVRFTGSFQAVIGVTPVENIEKGTFDPYTGELGWIIVRNDAFTVVSGVVDAGDHLKAFWPPAPDVFGARTREFILDRYPRLD